MSSDSRSPVRWALFAVLALMYAPVLRSLLDNGLWSTSEHGHGPVVLAVCLWLIHKRWQEMRPALAVSQDAAWAWPVLALGALLYLSGSILDVVYAEVGSAIPMVIGVLLLTDGRAAVKALAFPLCFMVFMIPLPGFIVEPVGQVMKVLVSTLAEHLLYAAGYPISRTGVLLQIGQYQLLVADACAGMRTLFMLEALGILYLNLVKHASWFRNISLALLIVPISFTANIIRVITLTLVTYYLGDEAGQGFLHGLAGMVLFASALALMFFADSLLRAAGQRFGVGRMAAPA
jgi:exosortase B